MGVDVSLIPMVGVLDLDDVCESDCVVVLGNVLDCHGDIDVLATKDVLSFSDSISLGDGSLSGRNRSWQGRILRTIQTLGNLDSTH